METKNVGDVMKKVLFVLFKKYCGILEGGGIANKRNLSIAQRILGNKNVDVVYIHDEGKRRSLWNWFLSACYFPFGYYNGLIPGRIKEIVEMAQDYDAVFISTSLFGMLAKRLKEKGYKGKVIVHFHNVESVYYDSALSKRMLFRDVIIKCAARNDEYSCRYADSVLALNERDSRLLQAMYGRKADCIVPIALPDQCADVAFDIKILTRKHPQCLFLGSYFAANNEGILWFVKNVLPHVDIELKIVGKGMAKLKEENECLKDLEVISDAPELTSYYLSADFMILPIFSGSGMKVKTCESLMYGKNILGTDEAFEGYSVDAKKIGGRCNNAEEYIGRIKYFAEHPVPRFNAYSRSVYEHSYSENSVMKVFKSIFVCLLFISSSLVMAQSLTKQYVKTLRASASSGVMYGHHDDTMYGFQWKGGGEDRSDTKDVVDMYPAMMSFELCRIEREEEKNIDGVPFDRIRSEVRKQYARGGFVTMSWHADNIVTGKNAWDVSNPFVVKAVLKGGSKAQEFLVWLDRLAAFLKSLKDEKGEQIPVIFRPWHECNGAWFWWGRNFCTPNDYKDLWKLTVKRLKKDGVKNVIYAYSPGANVHTQKEYLERYPGDKIITILGVEGYAIKTSGSTADRQKFIGNVRKSLGIAASLARERGKILALTETGIKHNTDTQWWTKVLQPAIAGFPVCFLVTWRNATNQLDECYGIYKGHPAEEDFKLFAKNPRMIFKK